MNEELIAPCGMNCTICSGFLAYQHDVKSKGIRMPYCAGCRPRKKQCAFLKKGCKLLLADKVRYCYECGDFPCTRLEHLDERYKTNFRMSMIENLEYIRDNGIDKFLQKEQENWQCSECGGVICCHNGICFDCGLGSLQKIRETYIGGTMTKTDNDTKRGEASSLPPF